VVIDTEGEFKPRKMSCRPGFDEISSAKEFFKDLVIHVSEPGIPSLEAEYQSQVVALQAVPYGEPCILHMNGILYHVIVQFIGHAECLSSA
jgi:hypothetical protein